MYAPQIGGRTALIMRSDHPLDGIAAKLVRADEVIKILDTEISEFLTGTPRQYRIESAFYANLTKYEFRAYSEKEMPLRFSVLAGEIVHQLRSCLDHLIVALAGLNGQCPINTHRFPVCKCREKFKKACKGGNLRGVSRSSLKRIIKAQPYRHRTPDDSTINVIHQLDIRDKHRLLIVAAQAVQIGREITLGTAGSSGPKPTITALGRPGLVAVTVAGAEVFSITLDKPVADFSANAEFACQVAFSDVGSGLTVPVIPTLTKMSAFTARLVDEFRKEF